MTPTRRANEVVLQIYQGGLAGGDIEDKLRTLIVGAIRAAEEELLRELLVFCHQKGMLHGPTVHEFANASGIDLTKEEGK